MMVWQDKHTQKRGSALVKLNRKVRDSACLKKDNNTQQINHDNFNVNYTWLPKRIKNADFMRCSWGVSNSYKVEKLNQLIRGWINYFKIGSMKTLCKELDPRIRYRLRMCIWKQWKTAQNREKNLVKLGIDRNTARRVAYTGKRIAYVCNKGAVNVAISNKRLASFGLISMLDCYTEKCVTC